MCLYDCVNGQLILLESDCIAKPCAQNGGNCSSTTGEIVATPCPPPFGAEEPEG